MHYALRLNMLFMLTRDTSIRPLHLEYFSKHYLIWADHQFEVQEVIRVREFQLACLWKVQFGNVYNNRGRIKHRATSQSEWTELGPQKLRGMSTVTPSGNGHFQCNTNVYSITLEITTPL